MIICSERRGTCEGGTNPTEGDSGHALLGHHPPLPLEVKGVPGGWGGEGHVVVQRTTHGW